MEPKPVRDDPGAQATLRETQDRRVPDDLVRQLHEADGRADALRRQLEATLGDAEYAKGERAGQLGEELRAAEREIEEISRRIHDASPPAAGGGGAGQ